nr:nucleobase-ascorbate transporter 6-like [Tanacetum cinerariifolium]
MYARHMSASRIFQRSVHAALARSVPADLVRSVPADLARPVPADLARSVPTKILDRIRAPYPFQWGAPSFHAGEAFAMMMAAFVALVESTGGFIAVSRYASATPLPPSILGRGVGWQGIGILLSGFFGSVSGASVSIENAGLLALTRVGSRRVVQISAGFMIFFSVLGKFGAVFASIPTPIIAALYCLFFAYVGGVGLSFLQFCNLNTFRTKFILGFSVFLGLSVPQYFNEYEAVNGYGPVHTSARWFNNMVNVPFSSEAFKKMHFLLLTCMSVVYVLTTFISEDDGDDATVEQIRKRNKRDNDDCVCRGLNVKDFKHTLKHKKEELTLVELCSHLRIEESLNVQDNDKPKGINVTGPY